jgi:hypothetical protein
VKNDGRRCLLLAIEADITTVISDDPDEDPYSVPLRLAGKGGRKMRINHLFMPMTMAGERPDDRIVAEDFNLVNTSAATDP